MASWRLLATRHVADGRKLLGALLEGPIVFTPFEEPGARGYRFRGYAVLTGLIEGIADLVSSPKYAEIWGPHAELHQVDRWISKGKQREYVRFRLTVQHLLMQTSRVTTRPA